MQLLFERWGDPDWIAAPDLQVASVECGDAAGLFKSVYLCDVSYKRRGETGRAGSMRFVTHVSYCSGPGRPFWLGRRRGIHHHRPITPEECAATNRRGDEQRAAWRADRLHLIRSANLRSVISVSEARNHIFGRWVAALFPVWLPLLVLLTNMLLPYNERYPYLYDDSDLIPGLD